MIYFFSLSTLSFSGHWSGGEAAACCLTNDIKDSLVVLARDDRPR